MNNLVNSFFKNCKVVSKYYDYLISKTKNHEFVGITNEWIIDNFYLLLEHKQNIKNNKLLKKINKSNVMFNLLRKIIISNNYSLDFNYIISEINKYQKDNDYQFNYDDLSIIIPSVVFILSEKLVNISSIEKNKLLCKEKVSSIINSNARIDDFFSSDFDIINNKHYIYEINFQLKEFGTKGNNLFREVNDLLETKKISLKEIINDCYQENIDNNLVISNIFNGLKFVLEISEEELYENISFTEKLLSKDLIYQNMTIESKNIYREMISRLAKKNKVNEFSFASEFYDTHKDLHIGNYLFKKKNYSFRFSIYIICVFIVSIVVSFLLSKYFTIHRIIGVVILFIPISQLVIQLINRFLENIINPKPLLKLDFSKGIPKECSTMVVIPTIIKDTEKIKEMFDSLENFYLINKSNNLYFTLLGDASSYDKEIAPYDKKIVEYGVDYADGLNKKYKKNLFYFVYRKRTFNEKEGCFLGYERKRGALLQFNKILLHATTKEFEKKYFNVNTFSNSNLNIKYVITLDTDTKLVLNSVLNLVGAMAHPLNKPILNKNGTKVVKGYGLMQPRVSVDIESTNKSLYSQIFAGVGGFDTYSSLVPNFYQETFGEGSFIGKGIYDLEIFDKLLDNTFPDNLILSHDLIEGNYMRCGYVGDIELIDDFPSKFLVDITRQHRWARGDTQVISYLFSKVKNKDGESVKNPISLFEKYKILDNIIRMFLYPFLMIILIGAFSFSKINPLWWVLFVVFEISLPIFFFLYNKFNRKYEKLIYYKNLIYGGRSLLLRSYIMFATIPFYAKLYLDAFFKSMYRMLYSHKNLLNWITAEEVEKTVNGKFSNYIRNLIPNIIVGLLFIILGIIFNYIMIPIGFIFISVIPVLYFISLDINNEKVGKLSDNELDNLNDIAYKTWKYFEENLVLKYHYLIPDNYQENRDLKLDLRTSPTAIGFSLISVISAYELGFIDLDASIDYINKIISSVEKLEKWNGHLYNWYDIENLLVLNPKFVSTVDSGNFVASLIVVREFLLKNDEDNSLLDRIDKLIKNANFKKLYTKKDVFSIGYDEVENALSIYNYNNFASEARLTSFVAIALGDVPIKHWMCLDKSLTTYKGVKGLISWSGTSFEYFMPFLFMKNYKNTLLDEAYYFSKFCQMEYRNSISSKLPWGIGESAYDELDNAQNYKYKAFATPYLRAKENKDSRVVISPYSSIMALELFPIDVLDNIEKFVKLDMIGKYGFYESYDYDNNRPVMAYFAHHQGMSLVGIANFLKNGVIKNYFHSNVNVKTYSILLKEKVQVESNIDIKMADYKKYNYNKEKQENDIRLFNYISYMPEVSVLSNRKYCLLMNDRGNSFSRYRTLQLNRYRKVTEQDYGIFLYIKDLSNNYVWSNTFAPINKKPDDYEVVFANDKIKFLRTDGDIVTKSEIIVTKDHNCEIRKITFNNNSSVDKILELTSYTEVILSENMDDVSHRVFNNMFISSSYNDSNNCLIMKRVSRDNSNIANYMVSKLLIDNPLDDYSYETERLNFIGRGKTVSNPLAINNSLTNYTGSNLDPICSIRNRVEVPANGKKIVYLIVGFGRSLEQINDIVNSYDNDLNVSNAFKLSNLLNAINIKNLNITSDDMRLYNIMLNYLYQTTKISVNSERMDLLRRNALDQSKLWRFGVSGDYPIILVEINDISDMRFLIKVLKGFEYYKNNSIFVDIIIINSEKSNYKNIINNDIENEKYRMYTLNSFYNTPGNIFIIDGDNLTREEKNLLYVVPRLKFIIKDHMSLKEAVDKLQKNNKISNYEKRVFEDIISFSKEKLVFDNGYGGFKNDGKEYTIYNNLTPSPWANVISNEYFGTIVTNNGCGFTYAYNSHEYKITSWTNDTVVNDMSEGFKFNGKIFNPSKCTHGFGYTILESNTDGLGKKVIESISKDESVKFYIITLNNTSDEKKKISLDYWINPVLGNFEEKTSRHILSEEYGNCLKLRNVYSINYSDVCVCMGSTCDITRFISDRILVKSIGVDIDIDPGEKKELAFFLVASKSMDELDELINKYSSISNIKKAYNSYVSSWKDTLNTIKIETGDKSFDYMINGWYLYQTMSSRLMAKAGFYQVSGAFGYRDQLQDAMNVVLVKPDICRNQILKNAEHQFVEGDVLHWWHDVNNFGLRSRYKDDYLWLVYAVCNYIDVTGDYDILKEQVRYAVGDSLGKYDNERGINFNFTDYTDSLFNHCLKSLDLAMNSLGKHGIPLMGGGDWNDGMNKVGIKGKGESVWLGFFLYSIIDMFSKIISVFDKKFDINRYKDFNENLKNNLNRKAWDKNYYLRAYFDNGDKLGSYENAECKIDLISQSFSIISGVIEDDKVEKVITAVEKNLVDEQTGIIKLLTPAFDKSLNNPGYIMNYPNGVRENGGQYTHAVAWYLMALIKCGYYDRAYKYYQMINPINKSFDTASSNIYKVEPYVIAADIYSSADYLGRGGWTWYTGSAGWFYNVAIRDVLGIKKIGNTLSVMNSLPCDFKEAKVSYKYFDTVYNISIVRGSKRNNDSIKLVNDGKIHDVKFIIK